MKNHHQANRKMRIIIGLIVFATVCLILSCINIYTVDKVNSNPTKNYLNSQDKKDMLNVLWVKDEANLSSENKDLFTNDQLKPSVFGNEIAQMLASVNDNFTALVQRYPARYNLLESITKGGLSIRQAYNIGDLMGQDYYNGYAGMKSIGELEFPRDYGSHNDFQFGWYFFVGNFKDENNNNVDILVNFLRRALYPPPVANRLGLSQDENQVIEMQLGLSLADKNLHVQGTSPVISGKTGLLKFKAVPFLMQMGNNKAEGLSKDKLFPMKINVYDPEKDLKVSLILEATKPLFLEGDQGKMPSMYNLGTWYYSVPAISATGTVTYQGDERKISGKMWMDNQWTAGVMPAGYPDNYYIRALANILNGLKGTIIEPWGWDWLEVQLDDNTEITLSAMHSVHTKDLKNTGDNPPPDAQRDVTGKIIKTDGTTENVSGKLTIKKWLRSKASGAWYPNGWQVEIPDKNIKFTMTPTVDRQLFQTNNSSEFREGGVIVSGTKDGQAIGGVGFGEGTGYAGDDYYFSQKFKLLGIGDNPETRKIFTQPVPGFWLVTQSLLFYLATLIYACVIIYLIFYFVFPKKN